MMVIALVTGASEGIGRGIALQLGGCGYKVYISGRNEAKLKRVVSEINDRGGVGKAVVCDHNDDDQTAKLFETIEVEDGRLDLLVNNAYSGVPSLLADYNTPFWDIGVRKWDQEMRVGLRSAYICTVLGTKLMLKNQSGLIINISSSGGMRYAVTPLYGVRMAALDRMVQDCHEELKLFKKTGISIVGIWPGPVATEKLKGIHPNIDENDDAKDLFGANETVEFTGLCVVKLVQDKEIEKKSGRVFNTVDLAREFGFKDVNGKMPGDLLSVRNMLLFSGWSFASWIPVWLTTPKIFLTMRQHKF